jgi:type I restriction enzyme S subunit
LNVPHVRLEEAVEYIRGITFKPEDVIAMGGDGAVVCMRTKNIQGTLEESDLIAVPSGFVKREELYLRPGDVLISSANSWNLVGKVVPVPELNYPATAGGFIAIVRAKAEVVDARYLFHWLNADPTQAKIRNCGRQTTNISNLSSKQFLGLVLPRPPLVEQQRVAVILDKTDSLRRKRSEAIRLVDDFLRAVFIDMFGDPDRNPKGFPVGTVRDLVATANYGTSEKANETSGRLPILRMNNITYAGGWDLSSIKYVDLDERTQDKYMAVKGDLLFNRTNSKELVGKTAVYDKEEPMAIAGYLVRVRMNKHGNPHYVSGYLNSVHGKKTLQGRAKSIVGMANINAQEMQDIPLLLPPVALQNKYALIVQTTNERLKKFHTFSQEADALHAALSQRFFGGAETVEGASC